MPRPTDISLDLSLLHAGDLLQLRLPHGLTVLLWPGKGGPAGAGGEGGTWSRTVDTGDVLLELGHAAAGPGDSGNASTTPAAVRGRWQAGAAGARGPARAAAIGLSWVPARQEEESRGSSATMAALGATMAALMLLLVVGSFCSCMFRCGAPPPPPPGDTPAAAPNRVPTSLRLQLKPTPYARLGAAGDYFKRRVARTLGTTAGALGQAKQLQLAAPVRAACQADDEEAAAAAAADPPMSPARRQHRRQQQEGGGSSPRAVREAPPRAVTFAPTGRSGSGAGEGAGSRAPAGPLPPPPPPPPGSGCASSVGAGSQDGGDGSGSASVGGGGCDSCSPGMCAICLVDFEPASVTMVLPCGHLFHHQCGVSWLLRSRLCPHCRADVVAGLDDLNAAAAAAAAAAGGAAPRGGA